MSEDEEDDEDLLDLWDWIDSQPWTDEDFERIREMEKKGGLTEEEKERCQQDGLP